MVPNGVLSSDYSPPSVLNGIAKEKKMITVMESNSHHLKLSCYPVSDSTAFHQRKGHLAIKSGSTFK